MKFEKPDLDWDRIRSVEWLLGYAGDRPSNWRFQNWNMSQRRLSSPFRMFLGEIERFSLDLGVRFDVPEATETDPRQLLLKEVSRANRFQDLMYMALERGTTTGSVYLFSRPDPDLFYRVYLFDECEVMEAPNEDGYWVQSFDGTLFQRWGFTATSYQTYRATKYENTDWELESEQPHSYGRVPGIQILNKVQDHSFFPIATFDWVAVELATDICSQMLAASSNFQYFGGPFLVSSFPEQTLQELMERRQVLTGSMDQGTQPTGLLQAEAMPTEHGQHLDRLWQNFCTHLGISWIPATPPGDTSSLTLRLLHSKSINTAQSYAETYLENGFKQLCQLILEQAPLDGVLLTEPTELVLGYENEIFPPTISEKSQVLGLVEQLIQLGIRPEIALQEYFGTLSTDQIQELMIGA